MTEPQVQGSQLSRIRLLLLACLWLAGCSITTSTTPVPIDTPGVVPAEVTRFVTEQITEQITQQLVTEATPTPAVPCAASQPREGAIVTIGAILPLSAPGAIVAGFAMQTSINIAVIELNERGGIHGIPVRLITYDSAGTPERSALFAERLILLDCAVAIVGMYHDGSALAVADVAHRYGIPMLVTGASTDDITARGYPEVFRLAPSNSMIAQTPALWLSEVGDYNQDGIVTATLIADSATTSSSRIEAVRDHLVQAGIEVAVLGVDLPSTDFSSVIARLVARDHLPDAILIYIKGQPALQFQAQLLAAGISPQHSTRIVQNHIGLDSAQFWAEVPNGVGTIVSRQGPWYPTLTSRGQEFVLKYGHYVGRWPESYAFTSYDAMMLLAEALRTSPTWAGNDLVATLETTRYEATSGDIFFPVSSMSASTLGTPAEEYPPHLWHQWQESQILYLEYTYPNQAANEMSVLWPPHYRTPEVQALTTAQTPHHPN